MKLAYQYMTILYNFQATSNHLHPLQVENCGLKGFKYHFTSLKTDLIFLQLEVFE